MASHGHDPERALPGALDCLRELALDLRWSWNHAADSLWGKIDQAFWEATGNPWLMLESIPRRRFEELAADDAFLAELHRLCAERERYLTRPTWFDQAHPNGMNGVVAYFSMEFGVTEALPIYSGGLGILAGDYLKAASDLGVPVAGIGLLYQQGYFRQSIDARGEQHEAFPYNNPGMLPVSPLRTGDGEWMRVSIDLPGRVLHLRVWRARVGRVRLYLLDSNDPVNRPVDRVITAELYGGDAEMRLKQEIVLGIGGWRVLEQLGVNARVCHLNEGHAAFAVLERARAFAAASGRSFGVALRSTRAGNLFTTHTPVPSGFDRFDPALIARNLGGYAASLGISTDDLLALGRSPDAGRDDAFNMAYLAVRGSGAVNAVSALHERVSRGIFQPLFPRWPEREVPVGHVTNGVHTPSWDGIGSDELWTQACGKERWLGDQTGLDARLASTADEELWEVRARARRALVGEIAERLPGAPHLDPNVLTIGFARRFTEYKRVTLLLRDPERLVRLLTNRERPVQVLVAGKAHPRDQVGRQMIRQWVEFVRRPEVAGRAFFLEDYDLALAAALTEGIDLWINTPRRPWEACGTSGMKVLVNGGLNLSELDGWWAEAYAPEVGWALGDLREHGPEADDEDARTLYALLENEVVPAFYERDERGMPPAWIAKVRASMSGLTPRFSANRMIREYAVRYYMPAALSAERRTAGADALGADIETWANRLAATWHQLHVGNVSVEQGPDGYALEAQVYLGEIDPDAVRVELYAEPTGEERAVWPLERGEPLAGAIGSFVYRAAGIPATRPRDAFTLRIVPHHAEAAVPLECAEILWQR